jgi:hypothetical protein
MKGLLHSLFYIRRSGLFCNGFNQGENSGPGNDIRGLPERLRSRPQLENTAHSPLSHRSPVRKLAVVTLQGSSLNTMQALKLNSTCALEDRIELCVLLPAQRLLVASLTGLV